jgi:hypothetical protein
MVLACFRCSAGHSTGWLQDPRPRPFYASAVEMGDSRLADYADRGRLRVKEEQVLFQPFANTNLTRPNWEFYRIPSTMSVPISRLYTE